VRGSSRSSHPEPATGTAPRPEEEDEGSELHVETHRFVRPFTQEQQSRKGPQNNLTRSGSDI